MASNAHLSRICLRAAPLRAGLVPAMCVFSSCPSATTASASRRAFSTTALRGKSVASVGKKVKGDRTKPPPQESDRPDHEDEFKYEPVVPSEVVENISKRVRPSDMQDVRNMQEALYGDETDTTGKPTRSLLDEVREMADELEKAAETESLDQGFDKLADDEKPDTRSFWYDEDDPETQTETREERNDTVDMPETAHIKLEEMREMRHWTRVAAWEMPLLAQFARPFEPPVAEKPLRFRYTTYMGDFHQSESKVVLEFSPDDMPLDEGQKVKLRKLAGPRWNPEKDVIHMSSESYENQAQNKRYLSDMVDKLLEAAKDSSDMFDDIPIDTRHYKSPPKPKFPTEWYMTPERKAELAEFRQRTAALDGALAATGRAADGVASAKAALKISLEVDQSVQELLAGKVYKRLPLAMRKGR